MVWFYQMRDCAAPFLLNLLSIPLWSDFISSTEAVLQLSDVSFNPTMVWFYRAYSPGFRLHRQLLSIPLWSDFILRSFLHFLFNKLLLSIPLWSDFISFRVREGQTEAVRFQSHYGLILSWDFSGASNLDELPFNPTMVWFYLFSEKKIGASAEEALSIPLWSDFIS